MALTLSLLLALPGCSIVSPTPLWELTKAAGVAVAATVPYGPTQASNTVHHGGAVVSKLCIAFNAEAGVADLVPALQAELRRHRVDSRVYSAEAQLGDCPVWLSYQAYTGWDIQPMTTSYRPYLDHAALTLRNAEGQVLSSSQYVAGDSSLGMGKWASTQKKLSPVVAALLTGFQD